MPFDRMVGEAYILMRADGRLVDEDVKRLGKKAGRQFAKNAAKDFDAEMANQFRTGFTRWRRELASATINVDFSKFRREFGSIDETVAGVTDKLEQMFDAKHIKQGALDDVLDALAEWEEKAKLAEIQTKRLSKTTVEYGQVFDKAVAGRWQRYVDDLARAAASGDFSKLRQEGEDLDVMQRRLNGEMDRFGASMRVNNRQAREFTVSLDRWVEKERILVRQREEMAAAEREAARMSDVLRNSWSHLVDERVEARTRRFVQTLTDAHLDEDFSKLAQKGENAGQTFRRLTAELDTHREHLHLTDVEYHNILTSLRNWATEANRPHVDSQFYVRFGRQLRFVSGETDRFGDAIGRLMGRGARNDFINLFGSIASLPFRAITAGFGLVTKGIGSVVEKFGELGDLGGGGGGGGGGALGFLGAFRSVLPALASALGGPQGIIAAIVALGAAMAGIAYVVPAVVSAISLLIGSMVALVGAIGTGITAGLLAIGPAAIGAAAGLAVLATAIVKYAQTDYGKARLSAFSKELTTLTKVIFPEITENFDLLLDGAERLFKDLVPSVKKVMADFRAEMKSPAVQSALDAWSKSLGRIAESVGLGLNSLLAGLITFFKPILPYAERLADAFERGMAAFAEWSASAEGQNSIADWMSKAWEVAKDLWGVVGGIGEALAKIFTAGSEGSGGSLLDSLNGKLEELNAWLDKPENVGKLKSWFADAGQIARDVGDMVLSLGEMVRQMNSPEGRANAKLMFDALKDVVGLAEGFSELVFNIKQIFLYVEALGKLVSGDLVGAWAVYQQAQANATQHSLEQMDAAARKAWAAQQSIRDVKGELDALVANPKSMELLVNDAEWEEVRFNIENYVFNDKQVPVQGNETLWNKTKGTVAAYVFDPKTIIIDANAAPAKAAIDKVRAWLATLKDKTIRVAGVNAVGGLTMATGGTVYGPTRATIGEAGPEAVVPLRRPLHMVDPSVRALSAIAQGMKIPALAGGAIAGVRGGSGATVMPGAVQVVTQSQDPYAVARIVTDSLDDALSGG